MNKIKLICVTWSESDFFDYKSTILYKTFIKNNSDSDFYNIHFNRNNYRDLEVIFNNKFGYQYEFILYRIYLLKQELEKLNFEYIIFSDTNDVVCLDNIQKINTISNKILFSSECHRYPNEDNIKNWLPSYMYPEVNSSNKNFLNAGLSFGNTKNYIRLFNSCINNVLDKEYKNFGGDQGVFTYYYINNNDKNEELIELDETQSLFLSTYSRSYNSFSIIENKLCSLVYNTFPSFIHDNGWNYGSPKFINHFNLLNI